jgi:hypothetical protein
MDIQPALRTRSSKRNKRGIEHKNKYAENAFWKRAKSIALHKQSRVDNQFEESDLIENQRVYEPTTTYHRATIFYYFVNDE